MAMKKYFLTIVGLLGLAAFIMAQDGSLLSTYLVGTFDTKTGDMALQIVNPTAKQLDIVVAFFDETGNPLVCIKRKISPNGLVFISPGEIKKVPATHGVVKIVSHIEGIPTHGVVGFQRHYLSRSAYSECNLAPVPCCYLWEELSKILKHCR